MPTNTASAALSAHAGAVKVRREALSQLITPERTSTFTPVAHAQVIDLIEKNLGEYGMEIKSEEYAIQAGNVKAPGSGKLVKLEGVKLFGVMVLKHQTHDDFSFALGIRTANDKTMALQLIAGSRIFVCDNMMFSGEPITVRKHTSGLDISPEIMAAVGRAIGKFNLLDGRIVELKALPMTDMEAKAHAVDAARRGVISERLIVPVVNTYLEPPHEEFAPRTMWSLHNAYTEVFKGLRPNIAMESAVELGKMFAL